MTSESHSGGELDGWTVSVGLNPQTLNLGQVEIGLNGSALATHAYGFGPGGRLLGVTNGALRVAYNYIDYSPLAGQIEFFSSEDLRMRQTRQYDALNRLTESSFVSQANGVTIASGGVSYAYNDANQRTRSTSLSENTFWVYTYDKLGQVASGKKYWADGTPVAGQQFEYAFDDIGNRTGTKAGGDGNGSGLRPASYSVNRLNQYTSRTVPGAIDLMGVARGRVAVGGSTNGVYRKGEYFWKEVGLDNAAAPVWTSLSVSATDGVSSTDTGSVFLPKTPEVFVTDADGNLLSDGRWAYTWNAENRLVKLVSLAGAGPERRLEFDYDWQGRRIAQRVYDATDGGSIIFSERYIYNGWLLLARINAADNTPIQTYLWGTDLSGTMTGAGGVGGLLAVCDGALGTHYPVFDGNGNVIHLVSDADATLSATYDYAPFGEGLRVVGPIALANPFRFSTKFQDEETGFLYYGYRYYNSATGRWLSRDPIGEFRSLQLYRFALNQPCQVIDPLGLYDCVTSCAEQCKHAGPSGAGQCAFECEKAQKNCPPSQTTPCGSVLTRSISPLPWWGCVLDGIRRICTPHQAIITEDGEELNFGGDALGDKHWTATKRSIYPAVGTSCADFSKCLKKYFADKNNNEKYDPLVNNCMAAVRGALNKCGGTLK